MNVRRFASALNRGWERLGIRARLFVVVTLVLSGVAVAISLYLPAHARAESLAAVARETSTVGRVAAHSVTPALLFADPEDAELVLEGVRATTGVGYLIVLDPEGRRFAAVGAEPDGDNPMPRARRSLVHRSATPIVHAGKDLGTVLVGASLVDLERNVTRIRHGIWGLSAALFVLATALTVALGAPVIRPLTNMAGIAERISLGERGERVPVTTRDEVGALARAMNLMLDSLQAAQHELEGLNQGLELRVEERTHELAVEGAERKRGQGALLRANERFELAASAIEGAIYDWDVKSDGLLWSDGISRVFGYPGSEILNSGEWWASKIHEDERQRVSDQTAADLIAGRDVEFEYRFRHSEGHYLNVLDRGRVLLDADGRAVRMVGVMENITALRQLEEQYLHSQRMEAVGRLAGGVAHDFNNLLTTILGYNEIVAASLDAADPRSRSVSEIRKAGERAAGLTKQLLAFSRKQPVNLRVLDIGVVLSDLEGMLRRLIGEDILFRTSLPPSRLCVRADRSQLDQLVINVAVNARDAMPNGGALTVSASEVELDETFVRTHLGARTGPHVLIEVRDTGIGMSSETLGRIFEPFYTTKEIGKGTGLGMSIVYGIVSQSGGYVAIDSVPGEGTRVSIYLPLESGEPESIEVVASVPELSAPRVERLMIVEDEEALRNLFVEHLRDHGYEVLAARDGSHALEVARAETGKIDLVVTDLVMPVLSGREMADRLGQERPGVRVLFMSGYPEDRTRDHADLAAGENYLLKPFTLQVLLRKIRVLLEP